MSVMHGGMYGNDRLDAERGFETEGESMLDAYHMVSYRGVRPGMSSDERLARIFKLVKSRLSSGDIAREYAKIRGECTETYQTGVERRLREAAGSAGTTGGVMSARARR